VKPDLGVYSVMFDFINWDLLITAILTVGGGLASLAFVAVGSQLVLTQLGSPVARGEPKIGGDSSEYRIYDHDGIKVVYSETEKDWNDYDVREINGVTVVANRNGIEALRKAGMI